MTLSHRSIVPLSMVSWTLLGGAALAGDVLVVSPTGPYTQIQPAIDAASDYDTILVKPNPTASFHYDAFVVHGKSLTIVGDPHSGMLVRVRGEMRVEAIPADGLVILGSLYGVGASSPSSGSHAFRTAANAGSIRVESCQLRSSTKACASIGADTDTQLIATDVAAGVGLFYGGIWGEFDETYGAGVVSIASALRLFGCDVRAADGGQGHQSRLSALIWGGDAGDALRVTDGLVFAADSTFRGGDGGNGTSAACPFECCANGGSGGNGIVIGFPQMPPPTHITTEVFTLGCSIEAGLGGDGGVLLCPGVDGQPGMDVLQHPGSDWHPFANGTARYLSGNPIARELSPVGLVATGAPGDRVYARIEIVQPPHAFPGGTASHAPLAHAPKSRLVFLGTIPASGSLATSVPTGFLPFAEESQWWRFHSIFVLPSGVAVESNDFVVAVVDWTI